MTTTGSALTIASGSGTPKTTTSATPGRFWEQYYKTTSYYHDSAIN